MKTNNYEMDNGFYKIITEVSPDTTFNLSDVILLRGNKKYSISLLIERSGFASVYGIWYERFFESLDIMCGNMLRAESEENTFQTMLIYRDKPYCITCKLSLLKEKETKKPAKKATINEAQ